jgi:hypothetical protein
MSQTLSCAVAIIGIDIGKNSFHVVGLDAGGAIVLLQKWSRGQVEARLANMPPRLIGMEACVGAHHLSRKLRAGSATDSDHGSRPPKDDCTAMCSPSRLPTSSRVSHGAC